LNIYYFFSKTLSLVLLGESATHPMRNTYPGYTFNSKKVEREYNKVLTFI